MLPAFFAIQHHQITQRVGTDAELLMWQCHGRDGAGVPCAPQVGTWCGQRPCSEGARRSYMASSSLCVMT
jgi:hypothetical protein